MTEISQEIFRRFQVRKSRAQKAEFIAFMREQFPELRVEEGGRLPRCRNLIIGDVDRAEILLSAHYDTCARLPFPNFICPQNMPLYILYSLLICIPFFLISALINFGLFFISDSYLLHMAVSLVVIFGLIYLVFFGGKANPNTANDNTSGVLTLCELYAALSPEQRAKTAFIFFDQEETGMFGSALFKKLHPQAARSKLLINFDCVSDGEHMLIVKSRAAKKLYGEAFAVAFTDGMGKTAHHGGSGTFYPSDQMNFRLGTALAAMHKAPLVGLWLGRIHTKHDTVLDESNLQYICAGMKKLYAALEEQSR